MSLTAKTTPDLALRSSFCWHILQTPGLPALILLVEYRTATADPAGGRAETASIMTKRHRHITLRIDRPEDIDALDALQAATGEETATKAYLKAARTWPALQARADELRKENRELKQRLADLAHAWESYQGAQQAWHTAARDEFGPETS